MQLDPPDGRNINVRPECIITGIGGGVTNSGYPASTQGTANPAETFITHWTVHIRAHVYLCYLCYLFFVIMKNIVFV